MNYKISSSKINNNTFGVNKVQNDNIVPFQERINTLVAKVSQRAEREVPEYGSFNEVAEYMQNLDKDTQSVAGKYGLKIYKMPSNVDNNPQKRYLEAAIYKPAGDYKINAIVGSGNKNDIINILKSEDFPQKLNKVYGKLLSILLHE